MLKRTIDILASLLGLIILIPLLFILGILVRLFLGSPVLFVQTRPGMQGRPFKMLKFRTMTNQRDSSGNLLPNEQRMTRFGKFLRAASLDELPELWNVLKGEMSLVGPRPLLMEYLPYFTPHQNRRHEVRPGITGWAQVNGRNAVSLEQRLEMDVWYVDNQSMILDLKILWKTLFKVVAREGIAPEGKVTMDRFDDYVRQKLAEGNETK